MRRWFYLGIGWLMLGLAAAGVVLPLLPTTPFLLVAAWAFARSSPALRQWLYDHPRFGRFLQNWHQHGSIPRRAKAMALAGLAVSWLIILATSPHRLVPVVAGLCMAAVGAYVASRPEPTGE